eukprot:2795443-Prymnesium_polylepis.1
MLSEAWMLRADRARRTWTVVSRAGAAAGSCAACWSRLSYSSTESETCLLSHCLKPTSSYKAYDTRLVVVRPCTVPRGLAVGAVVRRRVGARSTPSANEHPPKADTDDKTH